MNIPIFFLSRHLECFDNQVCVIYHLFFIPLQQRAERGEGGSKFSQNNFSGGGIGIAIQNRLLRLLNLAQGFVWAGHFCSLSNLAPSSKPMCSPSPFPALYAFPISLFTSLITASSSCRSSSNSAIFFWAARRAEASSCVSSGVITKYSPLAHSLICSSVICASLSILFIFMPSGFSFPVQPRGSVISFSATGGEDSRGGFQLLAHQIRFQRPAFHKN